MDYFHFTTSLTPLKAGEPRIIPLRPFGGYHLLGLLTWANLAR